MGTVGEREQAGGVLSELKLRRHVSGSQLYLKKKIKKTNTLVAVYETKVSLENTHPLVGNESHEDRRTVVSQPPHLTQDPEAVLRFAC